MLYAEKEPQQTQQMSAFEKNEQIMLNTTVNTEAFEASKAIVKDTKDNASSLKPSEIVDRSKLIMSYVISGLYSKDKSATEILTDDANEFDTHFKLAYQNASATNASKAQFLKFLSELGAKIPADQQKYVDELVTTTNQHLAVFSLEEYAAEPSTKSVLANSVKLLGGAGALNDQEHTRVIDAYAAMLESKNLNDVKIASAALQELPYGAHAGSQDYAKQKLEDLLASGDLSPKAQDIVDNNRVLGSPFDRKMTRIDADLKKLVQRKANMEEVKRNTDNMIQYLKDNANFATNTNYKNGKSPSNIVFDKLTAIADVMINNLKLNVDERDFVDNYISSKKDELKQLDRSISTPAASQDEDLDAFGDLLDDATSEDAVGASDDEIISNEEIENLLRRSIYDDWFWAPQSKEDEVVSESDMAVAKRSTTIPGCPYTEMEVESAIAAFESGVNALVISNERETTAVQNTELIAQNPALRWVMEYTLNNELMTGYSAGADKQELLSNFNRGYFDLVYDQMTVDNRFKGLQAIGGVKSQRMEQKIGLVALPFSLQFKPQNKELSIQMVKAIRSGEGGVFCAYTTPGTKGLGGIESGFGAGMTLTGLLSSNEGEKVTNFQNYFSKNMRSQLTQELNSDPGVSGSKLSQAEKDEILQLAQAEAVSIIQLNKVCELMGYKYSNGTIIPDSPKVAYSTAESVVGLFNKSFGGYREIEKVGDGSPKVSIHALIDSPWYFILPPKGILKDINPQLRTLHFRPYLAIGQFPYMKKNKDTKDDNLLDLDRGFGITQVGTRFGFGQDLVSMAGEEYASNSVLDADVVVDISWKKTINGTLGKANYDIRGASPSLNLAGVDIKGFYRGVFGGEMPEGSHNLGIFLFPDALWAKDAPWLHMGGNIAIDVAKGKIFNWQLNTSYDVTDDANILLRFDWNKFMEQNYPAVRLGLNWKF
jgi:hypothetical protein